MLSFINHTRKAYFHLYSYSLLTLLLMYPSRLQINKDKHVFETILRRESSSMKITYYRRACSFDKERRMHEHRTGIVTLLKLSTTTRITSTTMGEFYLEFLIPWIVVHKVDRRMFFSIITSSSIVVFQLSFTSSFTERTASELASGQGMIEGEDEVRVDSLLFSWSSLINHRIFHHTLIHIT